MSETHDQSTYARRQLEAEWSRARESWRDSTTDFFARYYWEPLTSETESFLRSLESLQETLRAAQEAARTW